MPKQYQNKKDFTYYPTGFSKVYIDDEFIGNTLKSNPVRVTRTTDSLNIISDERVGKISSILQGQNMTAQFSLPVSKKNLENFVPGKEKKGKVVFYTSDDYTKITLNDAVIETDYNINAKSNTISSIDITATALTDEVGNIGTYLESEYIETEFDDYTQLGYVFGGALNEQTSLIENYVYIANDEIKYLNTGGNRDWVEGNGAPDSLFVEATFKYLDQKCPFPVGAIFITMDTLNPSEYWNNTTWEEITTGRFLLNSTGTAEETGGSTNISNDNLPIHNHTIGIHNHTATITSNGEHYHTSPAMVKTTETSVGLQDYNGFLSVGSYRGLNVNSSAADNSVGTTKSNGDHSHSITIDSNTASNTGNTGYGEDYYQPYITCHMWIRRT